MVDQDTVLPRLVPGILQLDTTDGSESGFQPLETTPQAIGAPSLDIGYSMLYAGSVGGKVYAVEVPF